MPARIEDYALIGDCETAALVDKTGSIDWLCWPAFSSPACFSALLGSEENGYWKISPRSSDCKVSRRYLDHTLVLETTFEHKDGAIRLIDFMPVRGANSDVVRIVEGIRGTLDVRMELALRFDYGRTVPWVTRIEDGVRAIAGPSLAVLHSPVSVHGENLKTIAEFGVTEGERVWFTLTYGESYLADPKPIDPMQALEDTRQFWERWSAELKYQGEYREAVERSLITLKALTYRPTGGIVAAVTSSLPEQLGGQRNWDYRYCWLRDTTFTLLALVNAGYYDEAVAWQDWLLRAIAGSPDQVQIMYGIGGDRQLVEWEIDWLPGYEKSRPVRIGNAASNQVQLDIYGELLDSFFHSQSKMGQHTEDDFRVLSLLLEHLEKVWDQPDSGIWEMRGGPRQFTYSKMMCWVAFDRAVLLAEQLKYDAPVERWKKVRDTIHKQVCDRGFSKEKNAFVQEYDAEQLDASLLLMPSVGFLDGKDPRFKGTVDAINRGLMREGLLLRYDTGRAQDGLPPNEGAFLACSFWMVSSLKAIGRPDEAREMFERLLALRNDLGLLSEEYDVHAARFVGNFPQAFSHIALINAAFDLARREETHHRAERRMHGGAAKAGN
jgi:GH15 family glucan-1,4-alpha-glucosidase